MFFSFSTYIDEQETVADNKFEEHKSVDADRYKFIVIQNY